MATTLTSLTGVLASRLCSQKPAFRTCQPPVSCSQRVALSRDCAFVFAIDWLANMSTGGAGSCSHSHTVYCKRIIRMHTKAKYRNCCFSLHPFANTVWPDVNCRSNVGMQQSNQWFSCVSSPCTINTGHNKTCILGWRSMYEPVMLGVLVV